jgi:hypothetical protein
MKKEKTMHELMKEHPEKSYREMEKYREADREQEAGACIMGEMKKDREELSWQEKYNKEHKLRQEAEGELSIMKGIETNRVKEAQATCEHLQDELDRVKKENNDLFNRIANALEVNESHQKMNGKLQERLTELEEENKRLHDHFNNKIDSARKAGL